MRARPKRQVLALLAILVAGGGALMLVRAWTASAAAQPIPGVVRQTEIRIAPEISGRLASFAVVAGQHVRKGDLLAILDDPELAASLGEARAAAASAVAERNRIYSGARAEEVAIAAQNVQTALADLTLAKQELARIATLAAKNFASRQQLDDSTAALAKAQADLDLRRSEFAAANAGPTVEERASADARVSLAKATVADLEASFAETRLVAPVDGVVGLLVGEPGEVTAPGKPVMTLEVDKERWFTFTLREDFLQGFAIGETVPLTTDTGAALNARVTELLPLGEFATWRAARAVGDHDLNSFALRLDPLGSTDGLQPGMTVWLPARP